MLNLNTKDSVLVKPSEELITDIEQCADQLDEAFSKESTCSELLEIVGQHSLEKWDSVKNDVWRLPMVLAVRHERWDVVGSLIEAGHYYTGVTGENFKMLTGVILELPDSPQKREIQRILKIRCNNDFLNWIDK